MREENLPNFSGPLQLDDARSLFALAEMSDTAFARDGPRADVEYRDPELAEAGGGRVGDFMPANFGTWDLESTPA